MYIVIFLLPLLSVTAFASGSNDKQERESSRGMENRVFMPKGDIMAGLQFFYMDLMSSDSEVLMLLQHLNANASVMSLSPQVFYTYRDNSSVGLNVKYSKATGGISDADFSMLSDDLSFSLSDITADSRTLSVSVVHRSYAAIDKKSRIGVFTDLALIYGHTRTSFSSDAEELPVDSETDKIRFAISPGLMVFMTNNVSSSVSVGIGGASYSHTDYISGGQVTGTRNHSQFKFMLDILNISFGLNFHF